MILWRHEVVKPIDALADLSLVAYLSSHVNPNPLGMFLQIIYRTRLSFCPDIVWLHQE